MIALLDYGSGNLRSVHKALLKAGADVRFARRPKEIGDARAMVLPGVGAFDDCINALRKQELLKRRKHSSNQENRSSASASAIRHCLKKARSSIPAPPGWAFSRASVIRFSEKHGLKIPQIGWNQFEIVKPDCPLFRGVAKGSYVYFVHSFYPQPADAGIVATRTDYGDTFASSVWRDNVFATQFHPEKSQKVGLQLLKNFVALAK